MKKTKSRYLLAVAVSLMLLGCAGKEGISETTVPAEPVSAVSSMEEPVQEPPVQELPIQEQPTDSRTTAQSGERTEYVGIAARVKEIHEDSMLIKSDTDDFPGVFTVVEFQDLVVEGEIVEGEPVYILMENLQEKDETGYPKYKAKRIMAVSEEEPIAQPDILLTDAPAMSLTDVLSSAYNPIEIQSGNYSWTVEENGEGKTLVACGAAPLDIAKFHPDAGMKLPRYNKMDHVIYSFSTEIAPDVLVVRQWDMPEVETADGEAADGETAGGETEETITTYYYQNPFLELKPGKVYEFSAEWKKENLEKRKFCGVASYVLATN